MTIDKKIADRVKKLLRLAGSDNEHEAKMALAMANKILLENKLTRTDIAMGDYKSDILDTKQKRRSPEDRWVDNLLVSHFNVRIVLASQPGLMHILGTETDVEVAIYIRAYLKNTFKTLFRAMGLPAGSRSSFYYGLYKGIGQQLTEAKPKATQAEGLVLVKQDAMLARYQAQIFPKVRKHQSGRASLRDSEAREQGFSQGQSLSIRRGVGSGSSQGQIGGGR